MVRTPHAVVLVAGVLLQLLRAAIAMLLIYIYICHIYYIYTHIASHIKTQKNDASCGFIFLEMNRQVVAESISMSRCQADRQASGKGVAQGGAEHTDNGA